MRAQNFRPLPTLLFLAALLAGRVRAQVPGQEFDADLCPFQSPIAPQAVVDPAGASGIDKNAASEVLVTFHKWTYPVYVIDASTSFHLEDVWFTKNWHPGGHRFRNVPVPDSLPLRPDPTSDGHVCIVDLVHRISYDFWACKRKKNGTWKRTKHDGKKLLTCKSGDKFYLDGSGASPIALSAKGSGFALIPGLIRPNEIAAGFIPHALAMAIGLPASGGAMPPATLSDEESPKPYPKALPDGTRVRLIPGQWPDARIDQMPWSPLEKAIARALRDYGAFVTDSSAPGQVQFYAENPTYYPDPYANLPGVTIEKWGGAEIFHKGFFSSQNFEVVDAHEQMPFAVSTELLDRDGDGVPDAAEVAFGVLDDFDADPSNAQVDDDQDGLTMRAEWRSFRSFAYPSNPFRADSDSDGVSDAGEIVDRTDPSDPFDVDLQPPLRVGLFAVPEFGPAPFDGQVRAFVRGATGAPTYAWTLDGAPIGGSSPTLDLQGLGAGVHRVAVLVNDGATATDRISIVVGPAASLPDVDKVLAKGKGKKFKLVVVGDGFGPGSRVFVDGVEVATKVLSQSKVVAKGGVTLAQRVPSGSRVWVRVETADGRLSFPFVYQRP